MKEYDYSAWHSFLKSIKDANNPPSVGSAPDNPLPFDELESRPIPLEDIEKTKSDYFRNSV